MTIFAFISEMGQGKTLSSVRQAIKLRKEKDYVIRSNFNLNMSNVDYNPFFIMGENDYRNSIIIIDDILNLSYSDIKLNHLFLSIVSKSRKLDSHFIMTAQYYTMIQKSVRQLAELYKVRKIQLYERNGILYSGVFRVTRMMEMNYRFLEYNSFKYKVNFLKMGKIYDTNEVVPLLTLNNLVKELEKRPNIDIDYYLDELQPTLKQRKEILNRLGLC